MIDKNALRVKWLNERYQLVENEEFPSINKTWKQNETQLSELVIYMVMVMDNESCDPVSYWNIKEYNERAIYMLKNCPLGSILDDFFYTVVHYINGEVAGVNHLDEFFGLKLSAVLPASDWVETIPEYENLN